MKRGRAHQAGFTLIELLVTVGIIGILSAIAIPQFAEYRSRGFDARSLSDLRNAATGEEAYFTAYEHYVDCIGAVACEATLPEFRPSLDVVIEMFQVPEAGGVPEHFTGNTYHAKGNHHDAATAWRWNSSTGGLL